jgi:two-component system, OmpR family, sensor kinase
LYLSLKKLTYILLYLKLSSSTNGPDFKDNCKGMDEQATARLFDRYYRGTNTDSAIEGSGLGMAVTKELVQAMGGQIQVTSKIGQGTVISIIWGASD